jgi:hypothetical protein
MHKIAEYRNAIPEAKLEPTILRVEPVPVGGSIESNEEKENPEELRSVEVWPEGWLREKAS